MQLWIKKLFTGKATVGSTASLGYHKNYQTFALLPIYEGNATVAGGFPPQMTSNAEVVSMASLRKVSTGSLPALQQYTLCLQGKHNDVTSFKPPISCAMFYPINRGRLKEYTK